MVSGKYYGEMEISNRYRTFETIEATLENGSEKRNPLLNFFVKVKLQGIFEIFEQVILV
jgi:hypothetical protein